jgi:glycosyltransferase involved in cell wall biosynthesis
MRLRVAGRFVKPPHTRHTEVLLNRLFIDVGPLQEAEFTGIPQVAAKLCEHVLGDESVEPGFFYSRQNVPAKLVEQVLKTRDGRLFRWALERYRISPSFPTPGGRVAGLHVNIKAGRRLFPIEGQIIHDLTTVITPHFHTPASVDHHQGRFFGDLMSNDVTFCVSESTAADVRTYFPDTPGPVIVAPLGVDWDHIDAETRSARFDVEDYVFVLGTLEPRKNVLDVIELIARQPELAQRHRFVFGGRVGWGDSFERLVSDRGLGHLLDTRRIFRAGFVSEAAKYLLVKNAAAVIYPSVYEGFGLPVAEALSLGVPIVTTSSASLPEVGGDLAHYFVPGDMPSLAGALGAALAQGRVTHGRGGITREAWMARFSWGRFYDVVKRGMFVEPASPTPSAVPQEAAVSQEVTDVHP